jgi:hypothetical protein
MIWIAPSGFEDGVLDTAEALFRQGRILHAVLEYTPNQFRGRGTDYVAFFPRLYKLGAKDCYACHRSQPKIFRIKRGDEQLFHDTMFQRLLQTDVYCSFVETDAADKLAIPDWTPSSGML